MNIEQIVAEFKEKGMTDEEVITELEKTFAELMAKAKEILGAETPEAEKEEASKLFGVDID